MSSSVTPLPVKQLFIVSMVLFSNSFMLTVLLPYISFMVQDFGIPEDEVGRYAGYLVSAFMLGQLLFSYFWGWISDIWGRKPVIIIGLLGSGVFSFAFGFSQNYWQALLFRFICGSVNGILGVTKSYLSEITDESNQGRGFALLGLNRALGLIAGPAVGGFFAITTERDPNTLLGRFPYCIPTTIGFVVSLVGTLASLLTLKETRNISTRQFQQLASSERQASEHELIEDSEQIDQSLPLSLKGIFNDALIRKSIILYFMISFYYIIYDEIFAFWARLDVEKGGIGFSASEIGIAFSLGGVILLIYQSLLYPIIERRLGVLLAFKSGVLLSIPAFIIVSRSGLATSKVGVWILVLVSHSIRTVTSLQAFTSSFIMVSNSCYSNSKGSVNGVAQTFGSAARMLGPIFGGTLFSWSLETVGIPQITDFHLIFNILVIFSILTFAVATRMPHSINKRRL